MSVIVAEGKVVVTGDGTKVAKNIADDVERGRGESERAGQSVGRSVFGGVIGAWAAIGGTQLVTSWFTGAVGGASDLNETMSKSATIFGEHQVSIESWSNNAAKNLGLSKSAAMNAAAGFGDMFSQIGFTQDQAAAFSQMTVQMAADLGSFSNLDTADVSDRISAAFRGEYDSLQAVIPNINAARVETEAMAATGKKAASELTAQEKATAVLAIVQKDGARAMGDFAKTSDGAANAAKIATASLEDQQSKIGGVLLPMWSGFLSFVNTSVVPGLSWLADAIALISGSFTGMGADVDLGPMTNTFIDIGAELRNVWDIASGFFGALGAWVGENIGFISSFGQAIIIGAGAWVVMTGAVAAYNGIMGIMRAVTLAGGVAQWALNSALLANPIGIVIGLIAALVAGIVWVATQTTFFQDTWTNVTNVIGTAWTWLWGTVLSPIFAAIGAVFTWVYESVIMPVVTGIMIYIGLWAAIFTWLYGTVLSPVFAAIGVIFNWLYNSVISPVVGFISTGIRAAGAVVSWLWASAVSPALNAVGAGFNWVWNSVISPVANFISGTMRNVGNTIQSVFSGMAGFIGSAFQKVVGVIKGPINAVIGLVNGAIGAINKISVTIPDWVPLVGGQTFGVNIPRIAMLERGSLNSPDTFIAGERGPELITGARNSRVFNARDTESMLDGKAGDKHFHLHAEIKSDDPELGTRQAARELTKYFGV